MKTPGLSMGSRDGKVVACGLESAYRCLVWPQPYSRIFRMSIFNLRPQDSNSSLDF